MAFKSFDYGDPALELAKGIPAAIEGYYDAKHNKMKELEFQAKISADKRKEGRDVKEAKMKEIEFLRKGRAAGEDVSQYDFLQDEVGQPQAEQPQGLTGPKEGLVATNQMKKGMLATLTPEAQRQKNLEMQELEAKVKKSKMEPSKALRAELMKDDTTKRTKQISESYGRIMASVKNPSAAGDLSLIFNYMKMLDPGSVIRESEFKSAEEARGAVSELENSGVMIPSGLKLTLQKFKNGQKLLPEQRADFVGRADQLNQAQMASQNRLNSFYAGVARRQGIPVEDVVAGELFNTDVVMPQEGAGSEGTQESDEFVVVGKGMQKFRIKKSDLPAAQKDGFEVLK